MLDIYFEDEDSVIKLPYVPYGTFPTNERLDGSFETAEGKILTLIGDMGPKGFSIESFLPAQRYHWMSSDAELADVYINFFEKNKKTDVKVIVVDTEGRSQMSCQCTFQFNYHEKQNKDIAFTLEVKEYIDPRGN